MDEFDNEDRFQINFVDLESIKIGEKYPIAGIMNSFIEKDGEYYIRVNENILLSLEYFESEENISTIRKNCFNTGIFYTEVKEINLDENSENAIIGNCLAAVFKKENDNYM